MTFKAKPTDKTFMNLEERPSQIVDVPVVDPNNNTNLITYKKILKA